MVTDAQNAPALNHEWVRAAACAAGFTEASLVALPHANEERDGKRFREWVRGGRSGTMQYLNRKDGDGRLVRERMATTFPWARSALVCFASYGGNEVYSTDAHDPQSGWIARYAWSGRVAPSRTTQNGERVPSDYHKVLLKRLRVVERELHDKFGEFEARMYVDTGPLVERSLAVAAGLGWIGKNTCLIHPKLGSFGFLAVLLTSLEVDSSAKTAEIPDRCGSCTRCIEACPTDALIAPFQMDARRCISYLTIEHKGPIDESLLSGVGRQVFGCDICQDVCPWNGKARRSGPIEVDAELEPRPELINPMLDWLASLDERSFEKCFNGSPVRRTGFNGLRRNVAIAMGNSGFVQFVPKLEQWAAASDEGLGAAARCALGRLKKD